MGCGPGQKAWWLGPGREQNFLLLGTTITSAPSAELSTADERAEKTGQETCPTLSEDKPLAGSHRLPGASC
jgi:hypothetical protein